MINDVLLSTISEMMDKKFDEFLTPVNERLDKMDEHLHIMDEHLIILKFNQEHMAEKLQKIDVTLNYNVYNLNHAVKKIQENVDTITEILKINEMIPIAN